MKPHEIHRLNHDAKDRNATNLLALCANCHTAHHRYGVSALPFLRGNNTIDDNVRATKVYYEK
jgi:predicted HNH restriction endonuclease